MSDVSSWAAGTRQRAEYGEPPAGGAASQLRLALLTNIIPPFRRPLFQEIGRRCKHLRIYLSTPMESNRDWRVDWEGLDVTVQKTTTLTRHIGHNSSADERQFVHFPIDTVPALMRFHADAVLSSELGFRTVGAVCYRLLNRKSRLLTWVCVSESTEAQRSSLRHLFRRFLMKGIDGFLVNGDSGTRYLRKMGVPNSRIFRAPYPTDVRHFAAFDISRTEDLAYRMLYAGQFVERKGIIPFLRVLSRWAANHPSRFVELGLIGAGPLERAIRDLSVPANFRLSIQSFVPYDQMREAYLGAGIFVFPSLADEWGTVVSEAMACGLPVLGSLGSQAVEELVREGMTGWTFSPGDEEDMYAAIDRCLNTPSVELDIMREAAKESALRLSPPAIAEQVIEAVQHCLTVP